MLKQSQSNFLKQLMNSFIMSTARIIMNYTADNSEQSAFQRHLSAELIISINQG